VLRNNITATYPQMGRNPVPVVLQQNRQGRGRLRNAWPQGHMRTPLIVMSYPCVQDVSQVVLRKGNHEIEAFPPKCAEHPFADGVRLGTLRRRFQGSGQFGVKIYAKPYVLSFQRD
jgi:hypothetical protein